MQCQRPIAGAATARLIERVLRLLRSRRGCAIIGISLSHWASFVAWVRAGAEVGASPRLAFTVYRNMDKSIKVDRKRRGRPPTGRAVLVSSRFPEPVLSAVDAWASNKETTRSDAIRQLVEVGLRDERTETMIQHVAKQARERRARLKAKRK
jgi:hypothetical protein